MQEITCYNNPFNRNSKHKKKLGKKVEMSDQTNIQKTNGCINLRLLVNRLKRKTRLNNWNRKIAKSLFKFYEIILPVLNGRHGIVVACY